VDERYFLSLGTNVENHIVPTHVEIRRFALKIIDYGYHEIEKLIVHV